MLGTIKQLTGAEKCGLDWAENQAKANQTCRNTTNWSWNFSHRALSFCRHCSDLQIWPPGCPSGRPPSVWQYLDSRIKKSTYGRIHKQQRPTTCLVIQEEQESCSSCRETRTDGHPGWLTGDLDLWMALQPDHVTFCVSGLQQAHPLPLMAI